MNPGNELMNIAGEIYLQYPHLSIDRCYQLAREQRPDLAEAHHLGANRPRQPAAESDPGRRLFDAVADRMRAGAGYAEARRGAFDGDPAAVAAWARGEALETQQDVPGVASHSTRRPVGAQRAPGGLRRMTPGEREVPGRTYVAKMGDAGSGGGFFEVVGG